MSRDFQVPAEDIIISPSGAAGILIPIIIIVLILGTVLAFYVYRNRRLSRNFQTLASRYSAVTGAAILNQVADIFDVQYLKIQLYKVFFVSPFQGSLDDDDDSPIIRGFSDDEPLVIT